MPKLDTDARVWSASLCNDVLRVVLSPHDRQHSYARRWLRRRAAGGHGLGERLRPSTREHKLVRHALRIGSGVIMSRHSAHEHGYVHDMQLLSMLMPH